MRLKEELRSIEEADRVYFTISLKNGVDCRESGLSWVIKKLIAMKFPLEILEFPSYLDKKSKAYILKKVELENSLEDLMNTKRHFVN